MPTIFDRITGALQTNSVNTHVSAQAGALSSITTTVSGLIQHPPQDLGGLSSALQNLPLPNIDIGTDFGKTLHSISAAVPSDLSSLTGDLTSGLNSLQGQLGGVAGPLGKVLDLALAIYNATQIDLMCMGVATPSFDTPAQPPQIPSPIAGLGSFLDRFPSPMSVTSLLSWLDELTHHLDTSNFLLVEIPFFDSLRYPLTTLINWRNMPPGDVLNSIADTFTNLEALISGSVNGPLSALESALPTFDGQIPAVTLTQISTQLITHLGNLRTAIQAANLAGTDADVTAINAELDSYATLQQSAQTVTSTTVAALTKALPNIASDLEDGLGRVSSLLQVDSPLSLIPAAPAAIPEAALGDVATYVDLITGRLQGLVDRLDLSAIQGPLTTVAQAMQDAVDGLDAAQTKVTLQVQALFQQVETLVAQVDIAGLVSKVTDAIKNFQTTLVTQLQSLFQPVRDAIGKIIGDIDQGISKFDPASIVDSLHDAIGKLTGVLNSPDVLAAIKDIQSAVDTATKALQSLSFAPLTDQVIADIQQLTDSLKKIDTSQLSTVLKLALQAAVKLLPSDLTPISDPLLADLHKLINDGPAPFLAALEKQPKILLDEVRKYEPAAMLGDALSKPFNALLIQMNAFQPSRLLTPVQNELDTLKGRLRKSADPGRLLQPLEDLFNQLLKAFDQLHPEALVQPLNDVLHKVIDGVTHTLPVDEVFKQFDRVLSAIKQVAGAGDGVVKLLQRIMDMLGGLADPRKQIDAWMKDTLTNLSAITDTGPLQPKLDAVTAALTNVHAAALTKRFNNAISPLLANLATLDPQTKLVAIIKAYNEVSKSALAALPDSPQKTAILQVLNRFNPVDPSFAAPFTAANQVKALLQQGQTNLQTAMTNWDDRFHKDGALAELNHLQASPANLQSWVAEALDATFVQPVASVLSMAAPLALTIQPIFAKLKDLVSTLDAKLNVLLQGPNSLTGIRDKMQALVHKLEGLNFNFISDNLKDLFQQLRNKLQAISPTQIRQAIDQAFNAMLDSLQVTLLISADDLKKLDSDYQAVIDKLKQLDPGKLVTDVVQPEFEQTVLPLLQAFDPTQLLKALSEQLTTIDQKLKGEIGRVNTSYQQLLSAVPPINIAGDLGSLGLPSF